MRRFLKSVPPLALVAALVAAAPAAARAAAANGAPLDPAKNAVYQRLLGFDADVKTYAATVHLDIALKSFPYLSGSLDGHAYYERPDKEAVVFDNVPAMASQFRKVYPKLDPPASWPQKYDVRVLSDVGGTTTFRLLPRGESRVSHVDVGVDDAAADIASYAWTYADGGTIAFTQSYQTIGANRFVAKQIGHVAVTGYTADVSSSFSDYKLNGALPSDAFGS